MKLKSKILCANIITLFLLIIIIISAVRYSLNKMFESQLKNYKTNLIESKENQLKTLIEICYTLITEYQARVDKGEFSLEEAQKRAAARMQNFRYNKTEYFWINDLFPKMIMHPIKPEMNGSDLSGNKDPNGKYIFKEFVKICSEKGEGTVEYMWPKPGSDKPQPKLSYVKLFPEWGWILGTGIYIDEIEKQLNEQSKKNENDNNKISFIIIICSLVIAVLVIIIINIVSAGIVNPINKIIKDLTTGADGFKSASKDISSASIQLSEGAQKQAASLEESSATIEELSSQSLKNAEESKSAVSSVKKVENIIQLNASNAKIAEDGMNEAKILVETGAGVINEIAGSMEDIRKSSEKITDIIDTINEIA